jgi:hypothetical protein
MSLPFSHSLRVRFTSKLAATGRFGLVATQKHVRRSRDECRCCTSTGELNMTGEIPRSAIDRRTLISTLALLPVLSAPLAPISARAQTATSSNALPSWNEGPAKQAILNFVRDTTDQIGPEICAPGRAHCNIRSGWHALGGASRL